MLSAFTPQIETETLKTRKELVMKELNNHNELVNELTDMLITFDKECNQYQTDVYLYYDKENNTALLDTFVNVGGNSWLDDDHFTIYHDSQHYEDWSDYYTVTSDFAWGLDMEWVDFKEEVIDYLDLDDDEKEDYEIEYIDALDYIESREDYTEKLIEVYEGSIDEQRSDYAERAEDIISEWEMENL